MSYHLLFKEAFIKKIKYISILDLVYSTIYMIVPIATC